jgi:hypothetical protein
MQPALHKAFILTLINQNFMRMNYYIIYFLNTFVTFQKKVFDFQITISIN